MKKFALLLVVLFVCVFGTNVLAATNSTGTIAGPMLTPGYRYNTPAYVLTTPTSNSVTGSMVSAEIKSTNLLSSNFVSSNSRILTAELWEDDEYPNEDDLARTYTCAFNGRRMMACDSVTNDSGNLDSAGDKTVELFLSFKLTKMTKDPSTSTNSFFSYNILVA